MGEFDLKSSTLDKGLEIAKNFIDKLIMPSVEETGLLIKDSITLWRFQNQVKVLNKAKLFCDERNVDTKKISLKMLAPLLEYSSLEEDETMQDKWSMLLSNLVDSKQNIENHVFPYILSQLSKDEFVTLEEVSNSCMKRRENIAGQYISMKEKSEEDVRNNNLKIEEYLKLTAENKKNGLASNNYIPAAKILNLKRESASSIATVKIILHELEKPEVVDETLFKNFELSNLVRLGLIDKEKSYYAREQTLAIPMDKNDPYVRVFNDHAEIDLKVDLHSTSKYILTQLGELFFHACSDKK